VSAPGPRPSAAAWLGLLAPLYFAQGLPYGFFVQALPVVLRARGEDLETIGLSSLLALPWAAKFLWAPLVDRYGTRRAWILGLQLATVALLLALAFRPDDGTLAPLLVVVFLANLLAASQDIATDGLAVDLVPPSERGWVNGVQVAGYRVGMIAGGGGLLVFFDRLGWPGTFVALALGVGLATLPAVVAAPPGRTTAAEEAPRASLVSTFRQPGFARLAALLVLFKAGESAAVSMVRPLLVDRGLGLAEVGTLMGGWGFAAGLVGALVGGAAVRPLGRGRALALFGGLQAVSVLGYALLAHTAEWPPGLAPGVVAIEHAVSGMATATLFTIMMDRCRPEQAATDYTVQASIVVLATGLAASLSGWSAARLGYEAHFLAAAALAGLAAALALPLARPPGAPRTVEPGA
jgi:PAT family beta-lactamase induction signal transducer AmpG